MSLYEERIERLRNAVEMKPVDKIPTSVNGPAFISRYMGMTVEEYINDYERGRVAAVEACRKLGNADSVQTPIMRPETLALIWLSKIAIPGVDIPANEMWQVMEKVVIEREDYQFILEHGYAAFYGMVLTERLGIDMDMVMQFGMTMGMAAQKCAQEGLPVINAGGNAGAAFEHLCGGRSLPNFFMDLVDEPELVRDVLDAARPFVEESFRQQLSAPGDVFGCWVGGWRGAPAMLGHDMWLEFFWPDYKRLVNMAIEYGKVPILHLDSCWDRELEAFLELPARSCIMALDGDTDIRKARAVLGDHMCIMGDVPATMLCFSTPDEVYTHTTKLIEDIGPSTGYIVSSGCDIPFNANPKNVAAMLAAANDFPVCK